jgi:aminoglycoside phosphotransferase (APT) family kinase protein
MTGDQLEEQLKEYIGSINPERLGVAEIKGVRLQRLAGGLHNVNYLVEFDAVPNKFIARFHPGNLPGTDRTAEEVAHMQLVVQLPVPRIILADKPAFLSSTIMLQEFIAGSHKEFPSLTTIEVGALARVVARMHVITRDTYSPSLGASPDMHGTFADYLRSLTRTTIDVKLDVIDKHEYADSAEIVDAARAKLDTMIDCDGMASSTFSLLHTDIGSGNVIWREDGSPIIIDWEELSFGDPADEVAYIFAINNVDDEWQSAFLEQYQHLKTDQLLTTRLPAYILKNRLFDLAWAIGKLHNIRSGAHSGLLQGSLDLYQGYYDVRRDALQKILIETKS